MIIHIVILIYPVKDSAEMGYIFLKIRFVVVVFVVFVYYNYYFILTTGNFFAPRLAKWLKYDIVRTVCEGWD